MGIETDLEVCQLIGGTDAHFMEAIYPSLAECHSAGVHTQQQALDYLSTRVRLESMAVYQPASFDLSS